MKGKKFLGYDVIGSQQQKEGWILEKNRYRITISKYSYFGENYLKVAEVFVEHEIVEALNKNEIKEFLDDWSIKLADRKGKILISEEIIDIVNNDL